MSIIGHDVCPTVVLGCEGDEAAVAVNLERGVQTLVGGGALVVTPDDEMTMGRDDGVGLGVALGDLIFRKFLEVVGEIHALDIDGFLGGVVEFHPVALLTIFVDICIVGAAHLVDTHGMDALSCHLAISKGLEGGNEVDIA